MAPLLAGCGSGGNETSVPPSDFAITVRHVDGPVSPPDFVAWTMTVDDDSQGKLDYAPGAPGGDVPTWTAQFDVESDNLSDVYYGLSDNDLLAPGDPSTGDAPIGGASLTATVNANGETVEIQAFSDGKVPLAPVEGLIRRLVPRQVWKDFAKRRDAYVERKYGERP